MDNSQMWGIWLNKGGVYEICSSCIDITADAYIGCSSDNCCSEDLLKI